MDLSLHNNIIEEIRSLRAEVANKQTVYDEVRKLHGELRDVVTKSYLDARLGDLRRELLAVLRSEDSELRKIENIVSRN